MKRIFISILTLCTFMANAQVAAEKTKVEKTKEEKTKVEKVKTEKAEKPADEDLTFTSKNGHEVLPQAGDWGFGISANAPLTYLGSMIGNGSGSSSVFNASNQAFGYNSGTTVFGKYMVNSTTAYRARLSTNTNRGVNLSALIADDGNPNKLVQDKQTITTRGLTIGAGIEKRRGFNRLIGIYGAEALIGFNQGAVTKYSYANEISTANQTPTDGFGGNNNEINVDGITSNRTLKKGASSTLGLGAQVFLGVEYFIAPRLSLGGEFNWGIFYTPQTKNYSTVEFYNGSTNAVEEYTRTTKSNSTFTSGTGTLGGNANLVFYF